MSNREITSSPYTFGGTGILLKSAADEIPITSYSYLQNVFTDRENTLTVRRGWARIGTTPSATKNFPDGYLKATASASYRYASSNTQWCRATVGGAYNSIATGLGGVVPVTTVNTLANVPYIFLADGTKFIKDYGTGNATEVGLEQPANPLTLAQLSVTGADRIVVDDFDSGVSPWVATLLSGSGTVTATSIPDGYVSNAMRISLSSASSLGRVVRNENLDFGNTDSLTIEIYVRIPDETSATNLVKATMMFSIGDTTFNTRYEKSMEISPFQGTINTSVYNDIITTAEAQQAWLQQLNAIIGSNSDIRNQVGSGDPQVLDQLNGAYLIYMQQVAAHNSSIYSSLQIPVGINTWNIMRVSKSEFSRVGTTGLTDPSLDWSRIKAIAIEVQSSTTAGTTIDIDQWAYRSKGQITGTNISYTYTYYDALTQTESDYAEVTDVPYPGATGDQFSLSFVDTPAANATHRKIYRMGGLIEQFQLVNTIPIAVITYIDSAGDSSLTDVLNLDNQNAPGVPRGICAYDNRLFIWGITSEPPNRLRFSKRNKLESFPTDYWIPVGDGSETIVKCVEFDGELIIFTLSRVYRLIGTDEFSFRAISTRITQGLVSLTGVAKSTSSLYMASYDGIYEYPSGKRISEAVNPLWRGQTVNGYPPILMNHIDRMALGYHNQKIYVSYSDASSNENNANLLVYDLGYERWHWYQYGTSQMFSEPADSNINKLAVLLSGVYSGTPSVNNGAYIHSIDTGTVDQNLSVTSGIDYTVMTKELDLGVPDREKQFVDLVFDVNTNGTNMNVYYAIDTGNMDQVSIPMILVGIINTQSKGRQHKIVPLPDINGNGLYGKRLLIKLTGTSSLSATYDNQIKIYKIIPRFFIEPEFHNNFVTDWSDEGNPNEKIFREIHIEYNSYGCTPVIHLEVDGVDVYSFNGTPSNYRKKFYYSLPTDIDISGTESRLRIELM